MMKSAAISRAEVGAAPLVAGEFVMPPPAGRLNFFQQAMLLWDEVHPYNAVHAVRLQGPVNMDALRSAIFEVCRGAGIGEIEIDRAKRTFHYGSRLDIPIQELQPAADAQAALGSILSREMNTAFPEGPHHPTRWSAFTEAGGGRHYVVLAYHHVASDAAGIETLLSAVVRRYRGDGPFTADALPRVLDEGAERALNPRLGVTGVLGAWARLGLLHKRLHRVYQLPDDAASDDTTSLVLRSAPRELFEALSAACRRLDVGPNDAFMAALAHAIARLTPERRSRFFRKRVAIGTVLSGRKWLPENLANCFGVCLADLVTIVNKPDEPLESVLDQIVRQTKRLKSDWRLAVAGTALRVFFVRNVWPILLVKNHRSSYRRSFPVCGGVSTIMVEEGRFGDAARDISRYVRAAPPGPAVPIVLAPTVFADRLELCLIYRNATLSAGQAKSLMDDTLSALEALAR